jgi:hypothetical protein
LLATSFIRGDGFALLDGCLPHCRGDDNRRLRRGRNRDDLGSSSGGCPGGHGCPGCRPNVGSGRNARCGRDRGPRLHSGAGRLRANRRAPGHRRRGERQGAAPQHRHGAGGRVGHPRAGYRTRIPGYGPFVRDRLADHASRQLYRHLLFDSRTERKPYGGRPRFVASAVSVRVARQYGVLPRVL